MGGALKSIGGAIGGVIKQVAPAILKAVAPAASGILKGIVGDAFQAGGSFLNKLAGNLPGPLAGLAQKLLGSALPKLQQWAQGGIEKGLTKLMDMVTQRFLPGVGNVALPGLADPARTGAMTANSPSAAPSAPSTGSSSAAATAGGTSGSANTAGGGSGGVSGSSSAPNTPPDMPTNWEDRAQVEKYQRGMQAFQAAMQGMQAYFTMMSNIIKSQGDTAKQVIGNLR